MGKVLALMYTVLDSLNTLQEHSHNKSALDSTRYVLHCMEPRDSAKKKANLFHSLGTMSRLL